MSMTATLQDCPGSKGFRQENVQHPQRHSSAEIVAAAHIPGDRLAKRALPGDEFEARLSLDAIPAPGWRR